MATAAQQKITAEMGVRVIAIPVALHRQHQHLGHELSVERMQLYQGLYALWVLAVANTVIGKQS
jgi:hypothetical protein